MQGTTLVHLSCKAGISLDASPAHSRQTTPHPAPAPPLSDETAAAAKFIKSQP